MFCRSLPLLLVLLALAAPARAGQGLVFSGATLEGSGATVGLRQPNDAVVSPDGRFVYATGTASDSVVWFARDPASGALTWVSRVIGDTATPPGPVPYLDRPVALALSPDGAHLYVVGGNAGLGTSAITWFTREAASGALTWAGSLVDNSGPGLFQLDRPQDVLVSRDGQTVYVTAYEARAITVLARNPTTGALAPLQVVVDDQNGVDGLEGIQRLAESPEGAHLYVASASRPTTVPGVGGVAAFARAANGTLTFLEVEQQGVGGVSGLWAPRDVAVSPDGANVYVAAGGRPGDTPPQQGAVVHFTRAADGTLSYVQSIPESSYGGHETRGIAVSDDGSEVYVAAYGKYTGTASGRVPGKLAVFARTAPGGGLALVQRFDDGIGVLDGMAGAIRVRAVAGGGALVASELDPPGAAPGAIARFAAALPGPACANGIDDDGNGAADYPADPHCASALDPSEAGDCANGIDDDGDGRIDHPADAQCTATADASETLDCTNGVDDDGDGLVDAADPGCANPFAPERENPRCDDDLDNDGDGGIDWDGGAGGAPIDPQCSGKPARNDESASACGLGFEGGLAAALLAARRRRVGSRAGGR